MQTQPNILDAKVMKKLVILLSTCKFNYSFKQRTWISLNTKTDQHSMLWDSYRYQWLMKIHTIRLTLLWNNRGCIYMILGFSNLDGWRVCSGFMKLMKFKTQDSTELETHKTFCFQLRSSLLNFTVTTADGCLDWLISFKMWVVFYRYL